MRFLVRGIRKTGRVIRRLWNTTVHSRRFRHFQASLRTDLSASDRVIVMESMPWSHKMQQRPQHLARHLAALGSCIVYIDRSRTLPERVGARLYVTGDHRDLGFIADKGAARKYFWLFSTLPLTNSILRGFVAEGYGLIYDYMDDFHEEISGDVSVQLQNYNDIPELCPKLLLASASRLEEQLRSRFGSSLPILRAPNAADLAHFNPNRKTSFDKTPVDLASIVEMGQPIVGYYGAVAPWLDYRLLNALTEARPGYHFVFIGEDYKHALNNLTIRENVHYLGMKEYADLPSYSAWFDCAIVPFQLGSIAQSTSPVKLFEYMAMGTPTVCTRDLRECAGYDFVFMSEDHAEFAANVDRAISISRDEPVVARLTEQARENSWQARARGIHDQILDVEAKSASPTRDT